MSMKQYFRQSAAAILRRLAIPALPAVGAVAAFTACTNIECPLDNIVEMACGVYSAEDLGRMKLDATLTVSTGGRKDTVLLNQATDIDVFLLPLKQGEKVDTFLLNFSKEELSATDTLIVTHDNSPHFESLDCPSSVFHHVQNVRWTSHALRLMPLTIDSVAVVRRLVDYENIENIRLYLRSTVSH